MAERHSTETGNRAGVAALTASLAAAVRSRVGLKPAMLVPKIAPIVQAQAPAARPAWTQGLLDSGPADAGWLAFVESLLVHETYFFRHAAQLELLRTEVLPRLEQDRRGAGRRRLRIWCAGCATGEEPYSVAMMAREAVGEAAYLQAMEIIGSDLSAPALRTARGGAYAPRLGLDSFRAIPPSVRSWFEPALSQRAEWRAPDRLAKPIRFVQHNLLDPAPVHDADLVLCRNTLIYFDDEPARAVRRRLADALRPGGVLMLGSADSLTGLEGFDAAGGEAATVFIKRADPAGGGA